MGYYNTHSKESPMAQSFIAKELKLEGDFNTVEEICNTMSETGMDKIANLISNKILANFNFDSVDIILFNMAGDIKGKFNG